MHSHFDPLPLPEMKVFEGEATDVGWFSGKVKNRLVLTDKTKRFAIGIFEESKIPDEEKQHNYSTKLFEKNWVKLNFKGYKPVYAEISSIMSRFGLSKNQIINFVDQGVLEDEMQKRINDYLAVKTFVDETFNKNLNEISNNEIEEIINQNFGKIDPDIAKLWNELIELINKNENYSKNLHEFLNELLLQDCILKLDKKKYTGIPEIIIKFMEATISKDDFIKAVTQKLKKNDPKIEQLKNHLLNENTKSPKAIEGHLENFFNAVADIKDIKIQEKLNNIKIDFKEKLNHKFTTSIKNLEKVNNKNITKLKDELINKNKKFPQNLNKNLDQFFKELYALDKTFFPGNEGRLQEIVKSDMLSKGNTKIVNKSLLVQSDKIGAQIRLLEKELESINRPISIGADKINKITYKEFFINLSNYIKRTEVYRENKELRRRVKSELDKLTKLTASNSKNINKILKDLKELLKEFHLFQD